jgi:hypothetical protein
MVDVCYSITPILFGFGIKNRAEETFNSEKSGSMAVRPCMLHGRTWSIRLLHFIRGQIKRFPGFARPLYLHHRIWPFAGLRLLRNRNG